MDKKLVGIFLLYLGVWSACSPTNEDMILGQWKAVEITEEDSTLQIDLSTVAFSFDDKGGYTYTGNLNYREAGTYRVEQQYLYSTDTLHTPLVEKAVEIHFPNPDSLIIKMKDGSSNRIMTCVRDK